MVLKRATILLLFGAALYLAPRFSHAEPIASLKPTGYVNDFAHVLSHESVTYLESLCTEIDEKAKAQIAVVTVHYLDGRDIEGYAVDLYKSWGIGSKSTNRGVLILLASDDHRYRIEIGYGLEPILPDGKVGGFGREAVPILRQGDYSAAVKLLTQRVAETIAADAGITLSTKTQRPPPSEADRPQTLPFGVIAFALLVIFLLLFTRLGRWMLLGWLFSGGGGGRSGWGGGGGAGWGGGFGSGGGFGGFGGGSSGGGGASGSS